MIGDLIIWQGIKVYAWNGVEGMTSYSVRQQDIDAILHAVNRPTWVNLCMPIRNFVRGELL